MGRPAVLAIRITADAAGAQRGAQQAQGAFDRIGSSMRRVAAIGGALAIGAAVTGFATKAIAAASDLEQSMGGLDVVFGQSAQKVKAWSKDMTDSVRLPAAEYAQKMNIMGSILTGLGFSQDQAADSSKKLMDRAADLAAVMGVSTADAVERLTAGLKGEYDSLDTVGIKMNAASVEAEMARNGWDKLTGAAKDQAQAQAAMNVMLERSAGMAGAAASESGTYAAKMEALNEKFTNFAAKVGGVALPVLTSLIGYTTETALPAVEAFGGYVVNTLVPGIADFARWVAKTAQDWAPLVAVIGVFTLALAGPYLAALVVANVQGLVWLATMGLQAGAMTAVRIATTVWTAAQWLLNAALTANPVGLVIAALAALAIGIYTAYQRSETFRAICDRVWAVLKQVGGYVVGTFVGAFRQAASAVQWVIDKARSLIDWLGRIKMPKVLSSIGSAIGKIFGARAVAPEGSAAARYAAAGPALGGGTIPISLKPSTHVYVTIDGQQLQGRITRSITGALNAEGARYAAGGWA